MKEFLNNVQAAWKIDELRNRIILTITMLIVYRLGSFVILPGINSIELKKQMLQGAGEGSLLGLLNAFTGNSFASGAVFALGIMPYISASIIVQLLGFAIPYFARLQREGENGQRRMNQITRIITIAIAIVQGSFYLTSINSAAIATSVPAGIFWLGNVILLTAGTVFCMWLGERITDKGIGNGTSLLITAGIINSLPKSIIDEFTIKVFGGQNGGPIWFVGEIVLLVCVVIATVALVQAVRKIQIQYAKHMIGRSEMPIAEGSLDRNHLPIKLNAAGVMPIIFAQALMFIPTAIYGAVTDANSSPDTGSFLFQLTQYGSWQYSVVFFVLVVVFTYVYTALVVNPQQYAEFLKRQNAYIPGVKPGAETEEHIDTITSRITFPGAVALAAIAILPAAAGAFNVGSGFALFFGGTSLLILVSVILDTQQQVKNYLLSNDYENLINTGRAKDAANTVTSNTSV